MPVNNPAASSPGGVSGQIQFNDGGVFGGDSGLTYNKITQALSLLSGTAAVITDIPTTTTGVYAPTRSAEVNMDANVTLSQAQYLRVGSTVTVSGRFTANPALTATATSFEMTLPIASNLGAAEDLAGAAFCGAIAGMGSAITGSVTNNTAVVQWIASDPTVQTWDYIFNYRII